MVAFRRDATAIGTRRYSDIDSSFLPHPATGDLRLKTDIEAIKQSLTNLFYAKLGEYPFDPRKGSTLFSSLFEPLDRITIEELKNSIEDIVNFYEPRVRMERLEIKPNERYNQVTITLDIRIRNTREPATINVVLNRVR